MADDNASKDDFTTQAAGDRTGLAGEFTDFLKENKKWWLLPIIIMMLLIGGLLILAQGSAIAPFIYTLF